MYILDRDIIFETKVFKDVWYVGTWLEIQGSLIIVKKGFVSDGCTLAKDQPRNHDASRIHDALLWEKNSPITRRQKDKVFYEVLKKNKFKLGGWVPFSPEIYFLGVWLNTTYLKVFK